MEDTTIRYTVRDFSDISLNPFVSIFVRLRPLETHVYPLNNSIINSFISCNEEENKITIKDPTLSKSHLKESVYSFDRIFGTQTSQEELFLQFVKPKLQKVLEGYNTCCFAYGQTGSGKTHSMFGDLNSEEQHGMVPRAAAYIFDELEHCSSVFTVGCSFLEIYNERVRDLAKYFGKPGVGRKTSDIVSDHHKSCGSSVSIRGDNNEFRQVFCHDVCEDISGRVYVKDLRTITVRSAKEMLSLVEYGLSMRACHGTEMNATSSRSHVVLSLQVVQQREKDGELLTLSADLHLVDLAGSERLKDSKSEGTRKREAGYINSSLSNLAKVISDLDPNSNATHIPYRDCKLTRILQNSLSSDSYIAMLANINPHPTWYDESLSTLDFANRLRKVQCRPHVNRIASMEEMTRCWSCIVDGSRDSKDDGSQRSSPPREATTVPNFRLVYQHPLTTFSSYPNELIVEVHEHLDSDTLEVIAFDPCTMEEFRHLYLRKMKAVSLFAGNLQKLRKKHPKHSNMRQISTKARDTALGLEIVRRLVFT